MLMVFLTNKSPQGVNLGVLTQDFLQNIFNTDKAKRRIKSMIPFKLSKASRMGPLFMLLIVGCSTPQKVIQFVNKEANFKEYYSYSIINYKAEKTKHAKSPNSFLKELEAEITQEMESRDYNLSKQPDLLVRYETASGIKTTSSSPNYYNNPNSYNPYDPINQTRTRKHIEGLLLIEIKDRAKKLVWQGSLDIRFSKNNEENPAIIKAAVHRIFESFPYQAGNDQPIVIPSGDSQN